MKRTVWKKCPWHSEFKDKFGNKHQYPCPHKVRYQMTFVDMQGKLVTYFLCGIHKNSLEKTCARVNKLLKKDYSKLVIKELA